MTRTTGTSPSAGPRAAACRAGLSGRGQAAPHPAQAPRTLRVSSAFPACARTSPHSARTPDVRYRTPARPAVRPATRPDHPGQKKQAPGAWQRTHRVALGLQQQHARMGRAEQFELAFRLDRRAHSPEQVEIQLDPIFLGQEPGRANDQRRDQVMVVGVEGASLAAPKRRGFVLDELLEKTRRRACHGVDVEFHELTPAGKGTRPDGRAARMGLPTGRQGTTCPSPHDAPQRAPTRNN